MAAAAAAGGCYRRQGNGKMAEALRGIGGRQRQKRFSFAGLVRSRSFCTAPPNEDAVGMRGAGNLDTVLELDDSLKNKSIYLCFQEEGQKRGYSAADFSIKSIKLSDLFGSSSSADDLNTKLRERVYRDGVSEEFPCDSGCGVFGSKILFPAGGTIYRSTIQTIAVKVVSGFETEEPLMDDEKNWRPIYSLSLTKGRAYPSLMEINGKLYCIAACPAEDYFNSGCGKCHSFEVFDPEKGSWSLLPKPQILKDQSYKPLVTSFSAVVAGTKILLWLSPEICQDVYDYDDDEMSSRPKPRPKPEVYGFDVSKPNPRWQKQHASLTAYLPFYNQPPPLIVKVGDNDHDRNGFLVFTYTFPASGSIGVHFMEDSCKILKTLKPMDLPWPDIPPQFYKYAQGSLIHLGGRKICLVLHNFSNPMMWPMSFPISHTLDDFPDFKEKGCLFFITFEFEITDWKTMQVEFRFLTTPRYIEYSTERHGTESKETISSDLRAAFLLN